MDDLKSGSNPASGNQTNPYNQNPPEQNNIGTSAPPASNATPQQQVGTTSNAQQAQQKFQKAKGALNIMNVIIITVILIGLIVVAFYVSHNGSKAIHITTTSLSTSTIAGISQGKYLASCGVVNSPGSYALSSDIKASSTSTPCLVVVASNVAINCNGDQIVGSGPFSGVAPFSEGIELEKVSNVTITGCSISNFSYGVYAVSSSNLQISNNKLVPNYVSNLYLSAVSNSSVSNNYLSRSSSVEGSLAITNGSSNNKIINNTIDYNQFYGITINSTNNEFISNNVNHTASSFYCTSGNGFSYSQSASSNICYNSTGCNFVSCFGTNIPSNFSGMALSQNVDSCGSIISPGTYTVSQDLNVENYINASNPLFQSEDVPCITIKSSDVTLDCNNHTISNAPVGIYASDISNLKLNSCYIDNSSVGVQLTNVNSSYLNDTTIQAHAISMNIINSSSVLINNLQAIHSNFGAYLSFDQGITIQNFNLSDNNYGLLLNDSVGNNFNNGVIINNAKADVYASQDSSSEGLNLMSLTNCGTTNAAWASCKNHVLTEKNLTNTPLNSCGSITSPGNYSLDSNIINAPSLCIDILSNNVKFSCNNYILESASLNYMTTAVMINSVQNVSVANCDLDNINYGVNVIDSSNISIKNITARDANIGVAVFKSQNVVITNTNFTNYFTDAITLQKVSGGNVSQNNFSYGTSGTSGLLLQQVTNMIIDNNYGIQSYVGIQFNSQSVNNTVMNNSMRASAYSDYECDGSDSNISANNGGVDYGASKAGCEWLAALNPSSSEIQCQGFNSPDTVSLLTDQIYGLGDYCYSITQGGSGTIIDCNGHTIISTSQGVFFEASGTTSVELENCELKGFKDAVIITNSTSPYIINNTIYGIGTGGGYGIKVNRSASIEINNNTVSNAGYLYYVNSTSGTFMEHDTAGRSEDPAYALYNVSSLNIKYDNSTTGTPTGILLYKALNNIFQNNNFMSSTGMLCLLSNQSNSNLDFGGNSCASEVGCTAWLKSNNCK